jgi:hypothetical protein
MTWNEITVEQFMELHKLSLQKIDDLEKTEKAVQIIYGKTERQIEEMPFGEFNALAKQAGKFLTEQIPGKAKRIIKAGKQKFEIIYDPTKLKHRQYVEVLHFGTSPIENMNLIMASIVRPVKWFWSKENNVDDHEKVAEQLLKAKVCDLYHACVFFCNLYKNLMNATRDYLIPEMVKTGKITRKGAESLLMDSVNAMDGFTQRQGLRSMKESV